MKSKFAFWVRGFALLGVVVGLVACESEPTPQPPVTEDVSVSLSPTVVKLWPGSTQGFTAGVSGASLTEVDWTLLGSNAGTLTAEGVYTAPGEPGTYEVTATSVANPAQSATLQVEVVAPVSVFPNGNVMKPGARQTFTAFIEGKAEPRVTWSVREAQGGTIDSEGTYTAPDREGSFRVVATSVENPRWSGYADVTVQASSWRSPSIATSPAIITAGPREYLSFHATHSDRPGDISWVVEEPGLHGDITTGGRYLTPEVPGLYRVTAIDNFSSVYKAWSLVQVVAADAVKLTTLPARGVLQPGEKQTFSASISGAEDSSVTWSVVGGEANGSISPDGTYTAPATPGSYQLVATRVADPSQRATVEVEVVSEPDKTLAIAITPARVTVAPGAFQVFRTESSSELPSPIVSRWNVLEGPAGGDVNVYGNRRPATYVAPKRPGLYHLAVTERVANYGVYRYKEAVATIEVKAPEGVSVSVAPQAITMPVNGRQSFVAHVAGAGETAVTWSVQGGAQAGSITPEGRYQAPSAPGLYTVVATSVADPSQSASAEVAVGTSPGSFNNVEVTPTVVTLPVGASLKFSAMSESGVMYENWRVIEGSAGGTIGRANGVYTAPSAPGTYHVSVGEQGLAVVNVVAPSGVVVDLAPVRPVTRVRAQRTFTAKVLGTADTRVTWSASDGSISQEGTWTAPHQPGTYEVTATSVAEPSRRATTTVTVLGTAEPSDEVDSFVGLELWPASIRVPPKGKQTFTAKVTGTPDRSVTWKVSAGHITQEGTWTAPAGTGTYQVTATSRAAPSRSATVSVQVTEDATSLSLSPAVIRLAPGTMTKLSYTVHNNVRNEWVTWSPPDGGTLTQDTGVYVAPWKAGVYYLQAAGGSGYRPEAPRALMTVVVE